MTIAILLSVVLVLIGASYAAYKAGFGSGYTAGWNDHRLGRTRQKPPQE